MTFQKTQYIAHISNIDKREQTVAEHNSNVAKLARVLGSVYNIENLSSFAGRHHDDGKNTQDYLEYIKMASAGEKVVRGSVIHSTHGACFVNNLHKGTDISSKLAAEMLRTTIMSHHGLRDAVSKDGTITYLQAVERIKDSYKNVERIVYDNNGEAETLEEFKRACTDARKIQSCINALKPKENALGSAHIYLALYERLLTSIVIDADRTDTACFNDNTEPPKPLSREELIKTWNCYCSFCEGEIAEFQAKKEPSLLDKYRSEISQACAEYDGGASGVFRLVVPCGAGKTLSALRYALQTAKRYGKRHIFYIAPYNSILEQNANKIVEYVGDAEAVLLHNSNIVFDADDEEQERRYKLLTENWAQSPIIATSAVQFLNTLFSSKTSAVRRMQALGDSVIIIDEIQALPVKVLKLFNVAVNFLASFCNTSVLLCSATQPLLDKLNDSRVLRPLDLVLDVDRYNEPFKRVEIKDCTSGNGLSSDEAADFILEKAHSVRSILAIVNTKAVARRIAEQIQKQTNDSDEFIVFHLSTNMCPAHRNSVIEKVRKYLSDKERKQHIICVSTTLIEAGVDVSFECVVRSLTGLDSIVQAAGRCNRNREAKCGEVSVIYINDERISHLGHIKEAQEVTREVLYNVSTNPHQYPGGALSKQAMDEFYAKFYLPLQKKEMAFPLPYDPEHTIIDLLSTNPAGSKRNKDATSLLMKQAFKEAGDVFEVIEEAGMRDVIVEYNDDSRKHIEKLLSSGFISEQKRELRFLQQYTIQLMPYMIDKLGAGIRFEDEAGVMILSADWYDEIYGVTDEPRVLVY
jgi:CRISPR-associated endonuclease/helicase Cas3